MQLEVQDPNQAILLFGGLKLGLYGSSTADKANYDAVQKILAQIASTQAGAKIISEFANQGASILVGGNANVYKPLPDELKDAFSTTVGPDSFIFTTFPDGRKPPIDIASSTIHELGHLLDDLLGVGKSLSFSDSEAFQKAVDDDYNALVSNPTTSNQAKYYDGLFGPNVSPYHEIGAMLLSARLTVGSGVNPR